MRQMMTCAAALLVAACGAEAVPTTAVTDSDSSAGATTAVAAATAAHPESWPGSYRAFFDGADGTINIDPPSGSNPTYNVSMAMGNGSCSGEALGSGTAKGNAMTVIVPVGNSAEGWQECRISLTRGAEGLAVSEASNCRELHGAACAFSGMAKKTSAKAGDGIASSASGVTADLGAGRSYMEEGGAVGCSNSAVGGRAGRVLDRISANDECGEAAKAEPVTALKGTNWIVGKWVDPEYGGCADQSGFVFKPDGTYAKDSERGRWRLRDMRLTLTATYAGQALAEPVIMPVTLSRIDAATIGFDYGEGYYSTLKRCG